MKQLDFMITTDFKLMIQRRKFNT